MEREYGIGRVPADTDPTQEHRANIDAAGHMPRGEMVTCPNCGQLTYRVNLMTASLGTGCPNCWDDLADGDGFGA